MDPVGVNITALFAPREELRLRGAAPTDYLTPLRLLFQEGAELSGRADGGARFLEIVREVKRLTAEIPEPRLGGVILTLTIPVVTVSEANEAQSGRWITRSRRGKAQKNQAYLNMLTALRGLGRRPLPCAVCLTRIAPRELDPGDNYNSAFKYIRDGIAAAFQVDDRDPRIRWEYLPGEKRKSGECAVRIEVIERGYGPRRSAP